MCKLLGWFGEKYNNDVVRILKSLILLEANSNPHGLGIFAKTKNKEYLKKWESPIASFLETYHYLDIMVLREPTFIMCHLRFATTGVVSKEMAHPYRFSYLVGAHNGILNIKPQKKGESDTKSFLRMVNRRLSTGQKMEEVLKDELSKEIGDFTFVIYDRKMDQLFFIRRRRPLVFIKTTLGIFWVSTEEMWEQAKEIAKVSIDSVRILTEENVLYTIQKIKKEGVSEVKKVCEIVPPLPKGWWEWDYSYPRYSSSTRKFKNRDWYLYSEYDYWPEDDYWPTYNYYNCYDKEDEKDKEIIKKRLLKKS